MALLTCLGNSMVLWGRSTFRDESRSVSLVVRSLAVSDFFMGVYLIIISAFDFKYRGQYHENADAWMESWGCIAAGILSVISSEVSILILAFMAVERFLLISDPFSHHRLNTKNVMMALYIIWLVGILIAVLPAILYQTSYNFYGIHNGGTCFPLFIREKFSPGWSYSAFVFLGINLTLLILIATLYTVLLFSIWRTRRATTLNFLDCEFAIRFCQLFFFFLLPQIS
jgi:relaxin family peptide receptor 2